MFAERAAVEHAKLLQRHELARPVGRTALPALADELDARLRLVGVDELPEPAAFLRIADDGRPFALVRVDQVLHHRFELGGDAELVVDDDVADVVDAAFELLAARRDVRVSRSAVMM